MADASPIEDILKENASSLETESDAEKVEIESPEDTDNVVQKATEKYEMMNVPTERKVSEDVSKLAAQVYAAEAQKASANIEPATAHPEHRTYGVLGIPLAAAVHDYTLDQNAMAQATVKTKQKEDSDAIKEHNDSLNRIVKNIEAENAK